MAKRCNCPFLTAHTSPPRVVYVLTIFASQALYHFMHTFTPGILFQPVVLSYSNYSNPVSLSRPFLTILSRQKPFPPPPTKTVHFLSMDMDFIPCLLNLITYCLSFLTDYKFHENRRVLFCSACNWVLTMNSKLTSILWYPDISQVLNVYLLNQWTTKLIRSWTNNLNPLGFRSLQW